jgi:hypothetical protein
MSAASELPRTYPNECHKEPCSYDSPGLLFIHTFDRDIGDFVERKGGSAIRLSRYEDCVSLYGTNGI